MKSAEEILDKWLNDYPWQYWAKGNCLKAMEEYKNQSETAIKVGDFLEYTKNYRLGKTKPNLTIGKSYKIQKVKNNYRFHNIAFAIRDDTNVLRWYSFNENKETWIKNKSNC